MFLADGMLRTYAMLARAARLVGFLVLAGCLFLTIAFLRDGDKFTAFFCAAGALAAAASIKLSGWMRKRMKAWSDKFPPSVR